MLNRVFAALFLVTLLAKFPSATSQELSRIPPGNGLLVGCEGVTCVRKCCPDGQLINITSCAVPTNEDDLWKPMFYDSSTLTPGATPPIDLKFVHGFLEHCDAFPLQPYLHAEDKFYLVQDGSLQVPLYGESYGVDRYCIDKLSISLVESEEVALLCFPEPKEGPSAACRVVKKYVVPILLMVSCIFLSITLAVYICFPELHLKLHGRCLMSMVSSLLVAYIMITIVYLASDDMSTTSCLICAFFKHITLLAAFFWLNVMCFDIWRSLKSMRPASETSARSRRRFFFYSLYAWGCPLVIGVVAIIIERLPETHQNVIRPNFMNSKQFCWFDGRKSLWFYFYIFVLLLVIANTIFFGMVAYILIKSQNNQTLQRARSQNRDRMWLYGKLFLVMGITWITEVISWQEGTCEAWIFTDIVNALQGFTIFLVFVCKKTTRQMVTRRMSKMKSSITSRTTAITSTGKRSSTFFTPVTNSTSQNTDSSVVSYSTETRGLHGTPLHPMSSIKETNNSGDELFAVKETEKLNHSADDRSPSGREPNGLNYPSGVDVDRPSIERDSNNPDGVEVHDEVEIASCEKNEGSDDMQNDSIPYIEDNASEEVVTSRPDDLPKPQVTDNVVGENPEDERTPLKSKTERPSPGEVFEGSEPIANGFEPLLANGNHIDIHNKEAAPTKSVEESLALITSSRNATASPTEDTELRQKESSPLLLGSHEGNGQSSEHLYR